MINPKRHRSLIRSARWPHRRPWRRCPRTGRELRSSLSIAGCGAGLTGAVRFSSRRHHKKKRQAGPARRPNLISKSCKELHGEADDRNGPSYAKGLEALDSLAPGSRSRGNKVPRQCASRYTSSFATFYADALTDLLAGLAANSTGSFMKGFPLRASVAGLFTHLRNAPRSRRCAGSNRG